MQKNKIITALAFPVAVLLAWVLFLTVKVATMPEVTVRIAGYDPRDLLSGHYIAYTIDWDKTDCGQFQNNICPREEFGKHSVTDYWGWGEQHRFYIPEEYAEKLDRLFRINREKHTFEVIYKYSSGISPVARELLIDGKPWQQTIINDNRGENESN